MSSTESGCIAFSFFCRASTRTRRFVAESKGWVVTQGVTRHPPYVLDLAPTYRADHRPGHRGQQQGDSSREGDLDECLGGFEGLIVLSDPL